MPCACAASGLSVVVTDQCIQVITEFQRRRQVDRVEAAQGDRIQPTRCLEGGCADRDQTDGVEHRAGLAELVAGCGAPSHCPQRLGARQIRGDELGHVR